MEMSSTVFPFTDTTSVSKLVEENTRDAFSAAWMENLPPSSVAVAVLVPLTETVTPGSKTPAASRTIPFTVFTCAEIPMARCIKKTKASRVSVFLLRKTSSPFNRVWNVDILTGFGFGNFRSKKTLRIPCQINYE